MKFVDQYRDAALAHRLLDDISKVTTQPWVIMEICGGQTHAIIKNGLDQLLPSKIEMVHGPGCPVCVTPLELIDKAIVLSLKPEVILVSFGDMLRVPGSHKDLFIAKSEGADIRIVYSPLDALKIARENPQKKVVFFAVGFETTAPGNAMLTIQAEREGINNFSMLVSHVLVPPAMKALLSSPQNRVKAYLAAGHVCTVMGFREYESISAQFHVPIVVTGFEPFDILAGVFAAVKQLETGKISVQNMYPRVVSRNGNPEARKQMERVFEIVDRAWRGIGVIPLSGLRLRKEYARFDAERLFSLGDITTIESPDCISGLILQGLKRPHQCGQFGTRCTPHTPLGATMVSSEGACAAYYAVRKYHPIVP